MTKSQLIERIAEKAPHVPLRRIEAIVNAVFERMTQALQAGQRIELRGFGCFTVKVRPARSCRNPKTGASVSLQQRSTVTFAAGKELRERLNRVRALPQSRAREPAHLPPSPHPREPGLSSYHLGSAGEVAPRI
ncbi:integration host factor subunit beta [Hyalangium minutum]